MRHGHVIPERIAVLVNDPAAADNSGPVMLGEHGVASGQRDLLAALQVRILGHFDIEHFVKVFDGFLVGVKVLRIALLVRRSVFVLVCQEAFGELFRVLLTQEILTDCTANM